MAENFPKYPDIGCLTLPSVDEDTKQKLLNGTWPSCLQFSFPTRAFGTSGKLRKLSRKWIMETPWLRYPMTKDAVFCVNCCLFGSIDVREKTFTAGTWDWKSISMLIKRHAGEKYHLDASVRAEGYMDILSGKCESINKTVSNSAKESINKNRYILSRIIQVIVLCAKQNIPLRGHTENNSNFMAILRTFAQNDQILANHLENAQYNSKYTSPEIQNELIGICASQVKKQLLEDCRSCPFYAIMVDEATDKSTKEQLSFCVRFVDGSCAVPEEFLGFVKCESIKGVHFVQI